MHKAVSFATSFLGCEVVLLAGAAQIIKSGGTCVAVFAPTLWHRPSISSWSTVGLERSEDLILSFFLSASNNVKMLNSAIKVASAGLAALVLVSAPVLAVDEYGIRCNPGGGQLPQDGVICFAFRSGTHASDFGDYNNLGHPQYAYVAANGRGKSRAF